MTLTRRDEVKSLYHKQGGGNRLMTVKEISNLTGISVRELHYYDEIGLFTPTQRSEAGYRLYDDEDLKILLQILFFREFDIPLKKIKDTMSKVTLNRIKALQMQSKLLIAKKEHTERLISSIDDILNGDVVKTDFINVDKTEMNKLFQTMFENTPKT